MSERQNRFEEKKTRGQEEEVVESAVMTSENLLKADYGARCLD